MKMVRLGPDANQLRKEKCYGTCGVLAMYSVTALKWESSSVILFGGGGGELSFYNLNSTNLDFSDKFSPADLHAAFLL